MYLRYLSQNLNHVSVILHILEQYENFQNFGFIVFDKIGSRSLDTYSDKHHKQKHKIQVNLNNANQ